MTAAPRLHWTRGRIEDGARALEWIGVDDEDAARLRVIRLRGSMRAGWQPYRAVPLDEQGHVVARVPLAALRWTEAALAGTAR